MQIDKANALRLTMNEQWACQLKLAKLVQRFAVTRMAVFVKHSQVRRGLHVRRYGSWADIPLKAERLRNIFQSTYESLCRDALEINGLPVPGWKHTLVRFSWLVSLAWASRLAVVRLSGAILRGWAGACGGSVGASLKMNLLIFSLFIVCPQ